MPHRESHTEALDNVILQCFYSSIYISLGLSMLDVEMEPILKVFGNFLYGYLGFFFCFTDKIL